MKIAVITGLKKAEDIDGFIISVQNGQDGDLIEATITPHSWDRSNDEYVSAYFVKLVFR